MPYKNLIISLSLLLTITLLTWMSIGFWSYRTQEVKLLNPNLPDAFMQDVVALLLDKEGHLKLKIVSPKLIHYVSDDTTRLYFPKLTLYRKSPKPWLITAKNAKATDGIENIDFWDNVVIHHEEDDRNPSTLIKTSALTVFPNQNLAETEKHITLIQPSLKVNAKGMKANLNTGDVNLLSEAKGEYAP